MDSFTKALIVLLAIAGIGGAVYYAAKNPGVFTRPQYHKLSAPTSFSNSEKITMKWTDRHGKLRESSIDIERHVHPDSEEDSSSTV